MKWFNPVFFHQPCTFSVVKAKVKSQFYRQLRWNLIYYHMYLDIAKILHTKLIVSCVCLYIYIYIWRHLWHPARSIRSFKVLSLYYANVIYNIIIWKNSFRFVIILLICIWLFLQLLDAYDFFNTPVYCTTPPLLVFFLLIFTFYPVGGSVGLVRCGIAIIGRRNLRRRRRNFQSRRRVSYSLFIAYF